MELVYHDPILEDIVVHYSMYVVCQTPAPLNLSSHEMIVGDLPVHPGVAIEHAAGIFIEKVALVLEKPVFTGRCLSERLLFKIAVL